MNFDKSFERLIGHEGGYVNNPLDKGGETNWGISKRSYPTLNIASLTQYDSKAIYLRDFWKPAGCDQVPESVAFALFDMAVNSGVSRAVKTLQACVGTTQDGVLGPVTLAALAALDPVRVVAKFNGARLAFMADLPTWPAFGRGWARRVASNLMEA